MDQDQTVPSMDHAGGDAQSEQAMLDAVLSSSDFFKEASGVEEPLPEEHDELLDEVESDEEVPEESDEIEEEYEEYEEEAEAEDDEDSTQEADVYTADDLDLDAQVVVKIDGEEQNVSFAELLKGYQMDASLSKKGRELGEAKKALEEEKEKALSEVKELGEASAAVLMGQESNLAKEYHKIEEQIEKARDDGDTYEVNELKDKREQLQKKYWKARNEREGLQSKLKEQNDAVLKKQHEETLKYFYDNIEKEVPDWSEDVAKDVREFALGEGLPEQVVDSISDPVVVRLLNDYRKLKQGVKKGAAKRKALPKAKAVPAKKAKSESAKKANAEKMKRARAFKEDASKEDQMAFLRDYAAKSLGN